MAQRPAPLLPGPVETVRMLWRWLRRMRTALYLLGALAVAVLLGTIFPQRPNVADTVDRWLAGSEGPGADVARLLEAMGLFDVFGAPWFMLLLALLFVSLTSCLIPRLKAYGRAVRRGRPPRAHDLEGQPHVAHLITDADPEAALLAASAVLRRRRFRLRVDGTAAEAPPTRSDPRFGVVPAPADSGRQPPPGDGGTGPDAASAVGHLTRPDAASAVGHLTSPHAASAVGHLTSPDAASAVGHLTGADLAMQQVAAERGHLAREGGSLVFHLAFYLLLVGVVLGELTSFVGQVGVVEGHAFTDTPVAYWASDPGRWWRSDQHTGFVLALDEFQVDWHDDGQPVLFRSLVTVDPGDGGPVRREAVLVNAPMVVRGMKIHQLDWGYATRILIRDRGETVHDAFVPLTQTGPGVWSGVVKAPAAQPQLGLRLQLLPAAPDDAEGRPVPTGRPEPRAPLLLFTVYAGDLQLEEAQSVNRLDTSRMREVGISGLRPGGEVALPGGETVAFPELRRWTGFQVSRRPTVPLLLAAAALLLAGLLPALYAYRRRIWAAAVARPGGTRLTVAGHAFQRPQTFDNEFAAVVEELARRVGVKRPAEPPPAPEPRREVVGR